MVRIGSGMVSLAFALACGSGEREPGADTSAPADTAEAVVARAVNDAWDAHIAAARAKDTAAVMAIYAPDVTYAVPPERPIVGRDAVRASEAEALATADVVDATHRTLDLRVVDDRAYEIGMVTGNVRRAGETTHVAFDFMVLWQRQPDGGWAIRYLLGDT